jgi:PTH1 family peptidyl-tRNA hydrolase
MIVLGLGNPGLRYRHTRHNAGFRVVDRLAERRAMSLRAEGPLSSRAWIGEQAGEAGRLVLAKPRTYMNRSGRAAAAICRQYNSGLDSLVVVYDDADLALGRIRIRTEGGAGGHNGIRSMIEVLGSGAFARVRLGVRGAGRFERELSDYVLDRFEPEEAPIFDEQVELAADAVDEILHRGLETAMNRFNGRCVTSAETSADEGKETTD